MYNSIIFAEMKREERIIDSEYSIKKSLMIVFILLIHLWVNLLITHLVYTNYYQKCNDPGNHIFEFKYHCRYINKRLTLFLNIIIFLY